MALIKGDITCTTGIAKRVYDNMVANKAAMGLSEGTEAKALAFSIAGALYDTLVTDAVVTPTALKDSLSGAVTGTGTLT